MSDSPSLDAEYLDPVALTQRLVRFDTTNPSGNEGECIAHIKSLLDGAGIQNQVLAKTPGRPNLIARLPGDGSAAPLLLQGHVDVAPGDPSRWQQPPFGGDIVDGVLWGRGSLDMKGGIAMMPHAIMRAKADELLPPATSCSPWSVTRSLAGTTAPAIWWRTIRSSSKGSDTR
ncbi:MAG: M20/M25/M40 family metallo-hydrolase [Dehalococcoidia bacterium]|nr:M20/M25/M40 family metallo-hydrolase [Dehalococcoidia bacterium]